MNNLRDKIAFVIAFFGIIIALNPLRETLSEVSLNYGFAEINVLTLEYISLALLFLSVYFYALEYIKYGFKIFDRFAVFKYFQVAGNTFYFIAILSPIIYVIIWGIVNLFLLIPISKVQLEKYSPILGSIISFISLIIGVTAAWKRYRNSELLKLNHLMNLR